MLIRTKRGHFTPDQIASWQNDQKILLEESFQSHVRWGDSEKQSYIESIIEGCAITSILLGDLISLRNSIREEFGKDHEDYEYYDEQIEKGFKFIIIDGNNRDNTISDFYQDKFPLKETNSVHKYEAPGFGNIDKTNNKYSTLTSVNRRYLNNQEIPTQIILSGTRNDLAKLFKAVNNGKPLNNQEIRQAKPCKFADNVRRVERKNRKGFTNKVIKRVNGKKVVERKPLFDPTRNRRDTDEFVVKVSNLVANGLNKIDKKTLDAAYESDQRDEQKTFARTEKIINQIGKLLLKFGKEPLDVNGSTQGALFDLVILLDFLNSSDISIKNNNAFYTWFSKTQAEFMINPPEKFVKTVHACMERNGKDQKLNDDGTPKILEGDDILFNTLFIDPSGDNQFHYVGIQGNLQKNWLEMRFNMLVDSLQYIPDDILVYKDSKRCFDIKDRYQAWVNQGGKCTLTGKEIDPLDICNTTLLHMDHREVHSSGGLTDESNGNLVYADANLKKGSNNDYLGMKTESKAPLEI